MCGRFILTQPGEVIAEVFGLDDVPRVAPRYNIAPTQPIAIVRRAADRTRRELAHARWGLVPSWARDPSIGSRMINARAETVADKPSFRAAFRRRRCLVPADGWYEWTKGDAGARQPWLIRDPDGRLLAFAGLWETWHGPEGEELETATILTVPAVPALRRLHHRMPLVLAPDRWPAWLETDERERERLAALLEPDPGLAFEAFPVSRRVNNPRNEGPENIRPLADDAPP